MTDEDDAPSFEIPPSTADQIPPPIRRLILEAALDAVERVLANTPFRALDDLGRLEVLDVLGNIAYQRYCDRLEDDARSQPPEVPPSSLLQ